MHVCEEKLRDRNSKVNGVHVCVECARAWLEGWVSFTLLSERMCQISTPLFPVAEPCRYVYLCVCVCLPAIPVSFSY